MVNHDILIGIQKEPFIGEARVVCHFSMNSQSTSKVKGESRKAEEVNNKKTERPTYEEPRLVYNHSINALSTFQVKGLSRQEAKVNE